MSCELVACEDIAAADYVVVTDAGQVFRFRKEGGNPDGSAGIALESVKKGAAISILGAWKARKETTVIGVLTHKD